MVRYKYRWLYASGRRGRPGPKGPSKELIAAVGNETTQFAHTFGIQIDKDIVRRILEQHYRPESDGDGISWLTAIGHAKDSLWSVDLFRCESILLQSYWVMVVMDVFTRRLIGFGIERGDLDGIAVCRMFNHAISQKTLPKYDNDPLFRFHRWLANLHVLGIE
ncbi:MAG: helix-turn-helix domain-containing protein, partial [Gammaproteobacteria bacterium]